MMDNVFFHIMRHTQDALQMNYNARIFSNFCHNLDNDKLYLIQHAMTRLLFWEIFKRESGFWLAVCSQNGRLHFTCFWSRKRSLYQVYIYEVYINSFHLLGDLDGFIWKKKKRNISIMPLPSKNTGLYVYYEIVYVVVGFLVW